MCGVTFYITTVKLHRSLRHHGQYLMQSQMVLHLILYVNQQCFQQNGGLRQ